MFVSQTTEKVIRINEDISEMENSIRFLGFLLYEDEFATIYEFLISFSSFGSNFKIIKNSFIAYSLSLDFSKMLTLR